MRPVSVALPPNTPDGLVFAIVGTGNNARVQLTWNDNSITETQFVVQSMAWNGAWSDVGTVLSPLNITNTHGLRSYTLNTAYNPNLAYRYRVVAQNTVGYGAEFPTVTAQSISNEVTIGNPPLAPTTLAAVLQTGPQVRLTWRDNATNESGFVIERSTDGINFSFLANAPARNNTGNATYTDTTVRNATTNMTYTYRVAAGNVAGNSGWSNYAAIAVPLTTVPLAPSTLTATLGTGPQINLSWRDNSTNETSFLIQRSTDGVNFAQIATVGAGVVSFTDTAVAPMSMDMMYTYRVAASNSAGTSTFSNTAAATVPALPAAPGNFRVINGPDANKTRSVILSWIDNSSNETGFTIQRATNALFTQGLTTISLGPGIQTLTVTGLSRNTQYWFRIRTNNGTFVFSVWVNATPFPITTNQ